MRQAWGPPNNMVYKSLCNKSENSRQLGLFPGSLREFLKKFPRKPREYFEKESLPSHATLYIPTFFCVRQTWPHQTWPEPWPQNSGFWAPRSGKKWKNRNSGFGPLKTGKGGKSGKKGKTVFDSGSGPLKTAKGGKSGKDRKSDCEQHPREREENELRNEVRNVWLQPKRTPAQGTELLAWRSGNYGKRNLKKGLCSRDTFGAATFGGLGILGTGFKRQT